MEFLRFGYFARAEAGRNPFNPASHTREWFAWERAHCYDAHNGHVDAWHDERARQAEAADEKRRAAQRIKTAERKERQKVWRAGVARIMAEVRRREAERARLNPEPHYYSSDNPLDGERLWA
jgi:hypothetical protein